MTRPAAVRDALRDVVDPCSAATGSALDIVEMGLVRSIEVEGGRVAVEIRLTTPACHMVPYFITEVSARVGALEGVEAVDVETDAGLEWTAGMMSAAATRKRAAVLGEYAARHDARRSP